MLTLKWVVFAKGGDCIIKYNIFKHSGFMSDIETLFDTQSISREVFEDKINKSLSYYFWSRCEAEVVVTSWPPYITYDELDRLSKEKEDRINANLPLHRLNVELETATKVDIYSQVAMNWEIFMDYMWKNYQMIGEKK